MLTDVATVNETSTDRLDRNFADMISGWISELRGFEDPVLSAHRGRLRVINGGRPTKPPDQLEPEHAQ